jgi:hypothetical protein
MAVSKIGAKQGCVDVTGKADHSVLKSSYKQERGGWGAHALVGELYIVDKIKEGLLSF